jgi:hypothetical protein
MLSVWSTATLNCVYSTRKYEIYNKYIIKIIAADKPSNVPMTVINNVCMLIFIDTYFFDSVMIPICHACPFAICTIGTDVNQQY